LHWGFCVEEKGEGFRLIFRAVLPSKPNSPGFLASMVIVPQGVV